VTFRFATWNVWNLNGDWRNRFNMIQRWLENEGADVVCLQEISIDGVTGQPQSAVLAAGSAWTQYYSRSGEWEGREEGLALLSRWKVSFQERWWLPEAARDMPRQLCASVIDLQGHRVLVANTHLAFRLEAESERVEQATAAIRYLEDYADVLKPDAIIVAGDFNAVPASPTIAAVLGSGLSLHDVFQGSPERLDTFTFSEHNPLVNPALGPNRWIDYVFVSRSVKITHRALLGGNEKSAALCPSDHFGLLVEVDVSP
jgi:endonuclease/exonuclease/phosphatase family metal-dependent hydrolase